MQLEPIKTSSYNDYEIKILHRKCSSTGKFQIVFAKICKNTRRVRSQFKLVDGLTKAEASSSAVEALQRFIDEIKSQ
jgi:hypothetical protein